MKKLLLSISSFALSLSALNAAGLDLPENDASGVSAKHNSSTAEAVLSPLPGEGDVDPFTTAAKSDANFFKDSVRIESSQLERQSSAEMVAEEPKVEDALQAEDTATATAEAAEAVTEGPLRARYELKGEMLYVIIDLPPNTEQGASATGHNRQEGAQQIKLTFERGGPIKLTFERGVPNTTLSDTEEGAPAADPALPSR